MNAPIRCLVAAGTFLAWTAHPASADFKKGLTAYEAGNYTTALKAWRPLAEKGDADAQYSLGLLYAKGQGVGQSYSKAVHWYRQAAEQGDADAQISLGLLLAKGEGVPQDYVKGHVWLSLSAAQGNKDAAEARDLVAKKMSAPQIAEAQKLARAWK